MGFARVCQGVFKGAARFLQGACLSLPLIVPTNASEGLGGDGAFQADYDFYIGGLSIAEITFAGTVGTLGYSAHSVVETRGILELLVSGRVTAAAEGYRHTKGHLSPDTYRTAYQTRSESRKVNIAYTGEIASVSSTPPESSSPYDTDALDHPATLDPVTAAVTMMAPRADEDLCNRTIPVFDGKRRYDIILLPLSQRPEGTNPPLPTWDTPMRRCFGIYERIAGFDSDLQENQRFFPFDIWFEEDGDPLHRIVRLAGKTKLGYAIGTLRE